ncbi:hypothetical protein OF83DRAFT_778648 [Amylostereum chailletii]|nr:hypothetical protein OF83DRAFT_778648 [Amylostereum chailletii]
MADVDGLEVLEDVWDGAVAFSDEDAGGDAQVEWSVKDEDLSEDQAQAYLHQAAVQEQIVQRVERAVSQMLPALHGLHSLLADCSIPLASTPNVTEFLGVMSSLFDQFSPPDADRNIRDVSTGAKYSTTLGKRKRTGDYPALLPPPKEKKQKRKASHSVL